MEEVDHACIFSDMVWSYGCVSDATSAKICVTWKMFWELGGVLTSRLEVSSRQRGINKSFIKTELILTSIIVLLQNMKKIL